MTGKRFKATNISSNGMTGLFWLGKDQISVYDVVRVLNELFEENQALSSQVMSYKSELDVFANQNKKLERQIKEQFDLLIKARKQGFIDF